MRACVYSSVKGDKKDGCASGRGVLLCKVCSLLLREAGAGARASGGDAVTWIVNALVLALALLLREE